MAIAHYLMSSPAAPVLQQHESSSSPHLEKSRSASFNSLRAETTIFPNSLSPPRSQKKYDSVTNQRHYPKTLDSPNSSSSDESASPVRPAPWAKAKLTIGGETPSPPEPTKTKTTYSEALRYKSCGNDDDDDACLDKKERCSVRFQPTVDVAEIPSHRQCSKRKRQRLWSGKKEVQDNAERNIMEFRADGNDWRECTEEDEFSLFYNEATETSELIHPVTYWKYMGEKFGMEPCVKPGKRFQEKPTESYIGRRKRKLKV